MRTVLSLYVGVGAGDIVFSYGEFGKPLLQGVGGVHFNLSHSGQLAVLAVSTSGPLGVDIESVRPLPDMLDIARRFFCPEEIAELEELHGEARVAAFFACWTRKEACLKALGVGLSLAPDQVCVTANPRLKPTVRRLAADEAPESWRLTDLHIDDRHVAALAHQGPPLAIRWRTAAPRGVDTGLARDTAQ
jgi:4'-phosphopantetheinyl transferase